MMKRLQRRFTGIVMLALFVVLAVLLGAVNSFNFVQTTRKADAVLALLAENGGSFPQKDKPKPEQGMSPGGKRDDLSPEVAFETRYFVAYANAGGTITGIDTSHIAAVSSSDAQEYAQAVLDQAPGTGYKSRYRYQLTETATGYLVLFVDWGNQLETSLAFLLNSTAVGVACLLVVLLLVLLLSRRAIRPLVENMERQKQFITDAGHEIKTPLAIISANSEVLEMTYGENEWTSSTRNQVKRLGDLVQNLLTLSKMEEGGSRHTEEVCLTRLAEEITKDFASLIQQKQIQFSADLTPPVTMRGEKNSLAQLIVILMDNALKYTPDGGEAALSVERKGKRVQLALTNTCEQLPPGDLNRLFDRFYRADSSRSRESGGYGIGLSVARAVVEAHGGTITARQQGAHEICFLAEF